MCFAWQETLVVELSDLHKELQKQTRRALSELQTRLFTTYHESLAAMLRVVTDLDVAVSSAIVARAHAYTRPVLSSEGKLCIAGLRHPIIERLDNQTKYTPNDVVFDTRQTGYLVYGVNAAGKSSLMKSVGIAVIMAQAGMYVAAKRMEWAPYRNLFTRITKCDDLYNGMSSFQVEMAEVGNIVRRACARSLVIGDELCSGTETTSAVAIVGATIDELRSRRAHFILATHLHELRVLGDSIDARKGDGAAVRIRHMEALVGEDGVLTYTRRLVDGFGPDTYGIEACVGFGLPRRLCDRRGAFVGALRENQGPTLRPSSYNPDVFCGSGMCCMISGCDNTVDEVHHLVHQSTADGQGYLEDGRHKNQRSNLLPLCKKHHRLFHDGETPTLDATWVQTNHGPRLRLSGSA